MIRTLVFSAAAILCATPAFACDTIASQAVKLSFCIEAADWTKQDTTGAQEYVYFSNDQSIGFTLIAEAGAVSVADYRAAILQNAATGAGVAPEAINILGERVETIGGKPWNVIEYQVAAQGYELIFQNFYYVEPRFGSSQFVYWSAPPDSGRTGYRAGQMLTTVLFTP